MVVRCCASRYISLTVKSLYVHFPFCESKCHYCDFYSIGRERTQATDPDRFEAALHREAIRQAPRLSDRVDTIFFGGGTPSMTPPESMARALAPLELERRIHAGTEWTIEANPSSIALEPFRAYRELGVNRVSMGVQAMRDDLLTRLGRVHSRDAALRALETVIKAGFDNISVDLLCGAPGQTLDDLEHAISALTAFPITHLSCYLLTLPKTHRMFRELPDENGQLEHLLYLDQRMRELGFEHYEISNYAKPGMRARHNLAYWTGQSYLALGPSAHGYDAEARTRSKNVSSLHRYADLLARGESPVEWTESLDDRQLELERWMLALRLEEGFPVAWLAEGGRGPRAQQLQKHGLLEPHPLSADRLRLTARGMALSDQVISTLA